MPVSLVMQITKEARSVTRVAFARNPRRSFSALFRRLRKRQDVSFYGDYVLMDIICEEASEKGIRPSSAVILKMSGNSKEYTSMPKSQKMQWNRSLLHWFNV